MGKSNLFETLAFLAYGAKAPYLNMTSGIKVTYTTINPSINYILLSNFCPNHFSHRIIYIYIYI